MTPSWHRPRRVIAAPPKRQVRIRAFPISEFRARSRQTVRSASGGHGAIRRCPPLKLSAVDHWCAAEYHGRRRADVTLPDATIIELNAHAIGRIDSALVARINPDSAIGRAPVGPS